MHSRAQLVAAIVTKVTGLTTTSTRIYPYRLVPLASANLPGLTVADKSEEVIPDQSPFGYAYRELQVDIAGHASGASEAAVAATLDTIASEVETAMVSDVTLGKKAGGVAYTGMEKLMNVDGESTVGTITLSYTVTYMTKTGVPDTPVI